jgi:hypothetical protein
VQDKVAKLSGGKIANSPKSLFTKIKSINYRDLNHPKNNYNGFLTFRKNNFLLFSSVILDVRSLRRLR